MMRISVAQVWVRDQDEALAFYTQKLGMEVREDNVDRRRTGDFRWLTVAPPGQDDVVIALLAIPAPPVWRPEAGTRVRDLVADGLAPIVFLTIDDCRATYRKLRARGVEFDEKPQLRPWGIDASLRDPSGNHLRLVQLP